MPKRGYKQTEEHRRRAAQARRGRVISDETRSRMSQAVAAKCCESEHRQRKSEAAYRLWQDPNFRSRMSALAVEREADLQFKQNKSGASSNFYHDGRCSLPTHSCWGDMIDRCENERCPSFPDYGGRGISVCEEWHDPFAFYTYVSKLPHYGEPGYSLDRIDNDGNYESGNVQWASPSEQAHNRRERTT